MSFGRRGKQQIDHGLINWQWTLQSHSGFCHFLQSSPRICLSSALIFLALLKPLPPSLLLSSFYSQLSPFYASIIERRASLNAFLDLIARNTPIFTSQYLIHVFLSPSHWKPMSSRLLVLLLFLLFWFTDLHMLNEYNSTGNSKEVPSVSPLLSIRQQGRRPEALLWPMIETWMKD